MITETLPFLDVTGAAFSTRSDEVRAARARHWCARTPHGLAILRQKEAGQILRNRRFRQGSYAWPDIIRLQGSFAEFWKLSVISLEGDAHKSLRYLAQSALSEDWVGAPAPQFTRSAERLCDAMREFETFDIIEQFTEPFAGRAIATLLGLAEDQADVLAAYATRLGFVMGPEAKQHIADANAATDRISALASHMIDAPPAGSYTERLLAGSQADRQALIDLLVISIFRGVDTTRAQLAFAAHLFNRYLEQWTWLREHSEAVPQAIDEFIRMQPTTTWASREALEDVIMQDVTIAAGTTLHVFIHATSTDPRIGHDGTFDVPARRKPHFGFGAGAHHCLGHLVARTDMAAALHVWLKHWKSLDLAGTPAFLPDSGNTSPLKMPVRPVWDSQPG
ncbi:MAG: cytochrome P450 [Pseudomonadota bacterium]